MRNQMIFAIGMAALSTTAIIFAKRYAAQRKYKKCPDIVTRLHVSPNDTCLLNSKKNFPPNASDLAFVIVNENRILPIYLIQYDDGEFSDHRIYSDSFNRHRQKHIGCTVSYMTNLHGYGTMDGMIYCGESYDTEPTPHFDNKLCEECVSSIIHMSKPCDVLLCDVKLGALYDLYGNYKFSIRNYDITTNVNWDRTVNISIVDKNLQAIEKITKTRWTRHFGKLPIISPNHGYFVISDKQVIK